MAMTSGAGAFLREASDGAAAGLQESGQLHQSISGVVMKFSWWYRMLLYRHRMKRINHRSIIQSGDSS
jgi:hypothetical protein